MKVVTTRKTHYCVSAYCKRRDPRFPQCDVEIEAGEKAKVVKRRENWGGGPHWETYYFHKECPAIIRGEG